MLPPQIFALLLPALSIFVQAQSSTTTSSAPITTHTVAVGELLRYHITKAGLIFTPNIIQANVSDVVEFRFYPQNHSVARAEYEFPCIPYEYTGVSKVGFWSGFHPVDIVLPDPPKFSVTINDTSPIFFYCSAPGACINDGMVGVINPNSTETFATQYAFAKNSTVAFSPGENYPSEHTDTTSSSLTMLSTSTSTSQPSSSQTPTPTSAATSSIAVAQGSSSSLTTGAIIGIVIAAVALILLVACLFYVCGRARSLSQLLKLQHQESLTPGLEKPRQGDYSHGSGFYTPAKGRDSDRSQTQSPSWIDEDGREFSPMSFSPPNFQSSANRDSRMDAGSPSPVQDGFFHDSAYNATSSIPETLRVTRSSNPTNRSGPHELAVPSRNNTILQ